VPCGAIRRHEGRENEPTALIMGPWRSRRGGRRSAARVGPVSGQGARRGLWLI